MMIVWLAEYTYDPYDPPYFVGIYSTKELAEEAVREALACEIQYYKYYSYETIITDVELDRMPKGRGERL